MKADRKRLEEDVQFLRDRGYTVDIDEEGDKLYVTVRQFKLPEGKLSKTHSDILVFAPRPYPNAAMDMFWTDADLTLADGRPAEKTNEVKPLHHVIRRRWSRHKNPKWILGTDNFRTHWSLVETALWEAKA